MRPPRRSLVTSSIALALASASAPACQGTVAASIVQSSSPEASDEEAGWILLGIGLGMLAISATIAVASEGAMSAYLERHETEIAVGLARGSGAFVTEVAQLLHAKSADLPAISQTLREARTTLLARLHAAGPDRAMAFWRTLFAVLDRAPATHRLVADRLAALTGPTPPVFAP